MRKDIKQRKNACTEIDTSAESLCIHENIRTANCLRRHYPDQVKGYSVKDLSLAAPLFYVQYLSIRRKSKKSTGKKVLDKLLPFALFGFFFSGFADVYQAAVCTIRAACHTDSSAMEYKAMA